MPAKSILIFHSDQYFMNPLFTAIVLGLVFAEILSHMSTLMLFKFLKF